MRFKIIGRITDVEIIAVGKQIKDWTMFKELTERADGASLRDLP